MKTIFILIFLFCALQVLGQFKDGSYDIIQSSCGATFGNLKIHNNTDKDFKYSIEVKNASAGQTGEVEGSAIHYVNKNTAYSTLVYTDELDTIYSYLYFDISPNEEYIHVHGERTFIYHGASICFDGYYEYNKD